MRVLHVVKTGVGGTWAVRQIRELTSLGVQVHVACPDGPRVADYESAGASVHVADLSLPARRPYSWTSKKREIRSLVRGIEPDLIHSHFVTTTIALRLALGRNHPVPRFFQVPGPLHLENRVTAQAELRSAGRRDHWIASCRWTRQAYLQLGVSADRVSLSYYGSDVDAWIAGTPKLREELNVGTGTPIIGMIAYMYPPKRYLGQRRGIKGHEDLVDAVQIVREMHDDTIVAFVGGAWNEAYTYENDVRRYAHDRLGEAAVFLGTRTDVRCLYPDMTVVVHPSHSENLGGAVESSLLRVPAIATRVGGFPDLIEDYVSGRLVPPKNPPALAEAITETLDRPQEARQRAEVAYDQARKLCDIRKNAADVLAAYERAMHL